MNSVPYTSHVKVIYDAVLIPNLQSNSLIVMDNAPYHSRMLESAPTMSSRKQQMHDWLTAKGIEYPESALKRELF